jgi:hypothetical protein
VSGRGGDFWGPSKLYLHLNYIVQKCNLTLMRISIRHNLNDAEEMIRNCIDKVKSTNDKPIIMIGWSLDGARIIKALQDMKY